jgi:hypothetical protein
MDSKDLIIFMCVKCGNTLAVKLRLLLIMIIINQAIYPPQREFV